MRYHSHVAKGVCRRCKKPFGFYQVTKAKIYCKNCRAAERRDAIRFYNSREYRDAKKNIILQNSVAIPK